MRSKDIAHCTVTWAFAIFAAALVLPAVPAGTARAATTERVSIASDGTQGNDASWGPSISADGRFVAFQSGSDTLVEGERNRARDVFVHDRQTGQTTLVSIASDGTQGEDQSSDPSISADGRFVAFASDADNLVEGDTNRKWDIFVHDRQTGQTTRVSIASDGTQADDSSMSPSISADGRFIAFASAVRSLRRGNKPPIYDVFVHDRQTGRTERINIASTYAEGHYGSRYPSISADGRFVAFQSTAGNLVPDDTNSEEDVFVHDRQTGQTERVSVATDGTQGNDRSWNPSISGDGRFVAFESRTKLVEGDTNRGSDVFVHDRQTHRTTRVSVATDGTQGAGGSWSPSISGDGRFVAFESRARNLVPDDTNSERDIFVRDRQMGQTLRFSVSSDWAQGNESSFSPSISADGRFVAFFSRAANLVEGDTNEYGDVFIHDRGATTVSLTVTTSGSGAGTVEVTPSNGVYWPGTTVKLTAHADAGSALDHWEGDLTGSLNPMIVVMDADKTAVAHFRPGHSLTVQSTPFTGISIAGDKPGTTDYIAGCDDQEVVGLTAPSTFTVGSVRYVLARWIVDGVGRHAGRAQVQITMDAAVTATATYLMASKMYIEGPNERAEGPLPPATGTDSLDELGLFFVDIYAEDMPDFFVFQTSLQFLDDALFNAAGSGIFVAYNHLIPDRNAPWGDRQITWNQAFLPEINEWTLGTIFGLASSERHWVPYPNNNQSYYVDKTITEKTWLMTVGYWYLPGTEGAGSQTYTIGADAVGTEFGTSGGETIRSSVIAGSVTIGQAGIHNLTVGSAPIVGVDVTGNKPGTTNYTAACAHQEVVDLNAAPTVVGADGNNYTFLFWSVDSQDGPLDETLLQLTMDGDHRAVAVYNLLGDCNADCTVNVIDLLFVRNRLSRDVSTGDNWRADITGDGLIDVLDLLAVRSELYTTCGE